MKVNRITADTSFGQNKKSNSGAIAAGTAGVAATMAAPLIYGNGFKEYKNRNIFKLAAGACGIGILCAGLGHLIDKQTKRKTYLNSALGVSMIPLGIAGDYWSATNKKILKEKNKKFCNSIVNGIKKILDTL